MEQKSLAMWLKVILIGVGICGAIIYFAVIPIFGESLAQDYPEFSNCYWPWLSFIWMTGIPCYGALFLGWKIATNIGADLSFSNANAKYLKWISWLAAGDAAFLFAGNIVMLLLNMSHPGIVLGLCLVVFAGIAVAVAAAALSHLVQKAADMQAENDLTI